MLYQMRVPLTVLIFRSYLFNIFLYSFIINKDELVELGTWSVGRGLPSMQKECPRSVSRTS